MKDDISLVHKFMEKQNDSNYRGMLKSRQTLPAWNMMKTILETVEKNQVNFLMG